MIVGLRKDSLAFALSGVFFGLLLGWILGSQRPIPMGSSPAAPPAPSSAAAPQSTAPPPLDSQRAADLEAQAKARPGDAAVRASLGNLYFDAERYDLAVKYYEESLKLKPDVVEVSTDLAVCYYYTNQIDKALAQLDHSLKVDPKHLKSLLNQGIVRAQGKRDLPGAIESWEKVVAIAPDSEEARLAKQGLEGIKSGHQAGGGAAPAGGRGGQ